MLKCTKYWDHTNENVEESLKDAIIILKQTGIKGTIQSKH